jgi:hypothetical protein
MLLPRPELQPVQAQPLQTGLGPERRLARDAAARPLFAF